MANDPNRRTTVRLRCLRCDTTKPSDQASVTYTPHAQLKLNACDRCHTWNWEVTGDLVGVLTEDERRLERLFRKADPAIVAKSPVWGMLCALLDAGRVRDAGGDPSNRWCAVCESAPHVDGRCACPCHAAWEYRAQVEGAVEEKAA